MNKDCPYVKNHIALHEYFTDPHELSILVCEDIEADNETFILIHEPSVSTCENKRHMREH